LKGLITFGNNEINKLKSELKNKLKNKFRNSLAGGPRACPTQADNSKF
jgi:hypothetical protein